MNISNENLSNEVIVNGEICRVVYSNDENDFRVYKVKTDNGIISCAGKCSKYRLGESVKVVGELEENKYGKQIKIKSISADNSIVTIEGLVDSICGLVYGLGPAKAKKLIDHYGGPQDFISEMDTISILSNAETEYPGPSIISFDIFSNLVKEWSNTASERQVEAELCSLEITPSLRNKLRAQYGSNAINILKTNPYKLAFEVDGVGFLTADDIAIRCGVNCNSKERLDSAVFYSFQDIAQTKGHTKIEIDDLIKKLREIFYKRSAHSEFLKNEQDSVLNSLERLQSAEKVIRYNDSFSLKEIFDYESRIAADLARLLSSPIERAPMARSAATGATGGATGASLTDEQSAAVDAVIEKGLLVITGGPGVGKTTTCKSIVDSAISSGLTVSLCSPTARAAKRLSESTGMNAVTIHRLLEPQSAIGRFARNEENPLPCDLLLVDETSMVDSQLMSLLLRSVSDKTRVVFVGDINQLPPVGSGCPFRDIILSGKIPTVRLTKIHRQAEGSFIVTGSHSILNGKKPKFSNQGNRDDGCLHMINCGAKEAALVTLNVISDISDEFQINKDDIIVLSPMRKGDAGVNNLNKNIQAILNPPDDLKTEITIGSQENERTLRLGDKVRQTKNDYNRGIVNGDVGKIKFIQHPDYKYHKDEIILTVDFDGNTVGYTREQINNLVLSYCVTIHSVQGSEASVVVLVLVKGHYIMLTRTLVYTAITRAKRACIVVGDEGAVATSAYNDKDEKRKTILSDILVSV